MDNEQLNFWICWDDTNAKEPCFLCKGDPSEVLYELEEFSDLNGEPFQLPMPTRKYDELHTAKLFDYRELGDSFILAFVKYLGEGFKIRSDGFKFVDLDYHPMCGVITRAGTVVIPFSYSSIYYDKDSRLFSCYKYMNRKERIIHYRTESGELIIKHNGANTLVSKYYDDFQEFSEGLCAVRMCSPNYPNGNGWGFVNSDGNEAIECKSEYKSVSDFQDGFAVVHKVEKTQFLGLSPRLFYNYISVDGNELLDSGVVEAYPFQEGFAKIRIFGVPSLFTINKKGLLLANIDGIDKWVPLDAVKAQRIK